MSLARGPRKAVALAALAAGMSLVSCNNPGDQKAPAAPQIQAPQAPALVLIDAIAPDLDTVYVHYVCAAVDSIGLTDKNGQSAWNHQRRPSTPGHPVTIIWKPDPTVTIDSIKPKPGPDALPIDVDPVLKGGSPGGLYKGTVQSTAGVPGNPPAGNPTFKSYPYGLKLTCGTGPSSRHLVVDPEMIIKKP